MNTKVPETIYLQWHTEDCPENCGHEVTWCWDKIEETDIEYIRKDLYDILLKNHLELQEKSYGTKSDMMK